MLERQREGIAKAKTDGLATGTGPAKIARQLARSSLYLALKGPGHE
jgi:hypothetical protein